MEKKMKQWSIKRNKKTKDRAMRTPLTTGMNSGYKLVITPEIRMRRWSYCDYNKRNMPVVIYNTDIP